MSGFSVLDVSSSEDENESIIVERETCLDKELLIKEINKLRIEKGLSQEEESDCDKVKELILNGYYGQQGVGNKRGDVESVKRNGNESKIKRREGVERNGEKTTKNGCTSTNSDELASRRISISFA